MADLRLTEIDDLLRTDHVRLGASDECYFMREYASGAGYAHSATNDLISNLKKPVDRRGQPEWRYKEAAMRQVAKELAGAIRPSYLDSATLVPMPPSKSKSDPLYDDRMLTILRLMAGTRSLDIRELLQQRLSTEAAHTSTTPRYPASIEANYYVDEAVASPEPTDIALFDDIITTGAHFRAANAVMSRRFPGVRILGIFIARRVFPPEGT